MEQHHHHTPQWRSQAACRGLDPELFFPKRGERVGAAKAVCARCPVCAECLELGLEEHLGVWGGTTEYERRRIRQRRQAEEVA